MALFGGSSGGYTLPGNLNGIVRRFFLTSTFPAELQSPQDLAVVSTLELWRIWRRETTEQLVHYGKRRRWKWELVDYVELIT
jgi:hypothetical protein